MPFYHDWCRIFRNDNAYSLRRSCCSIISFRCYDVKSWFRGQKSTHIPIGLIVSIVILLEVLVVVGGWKYKTNFVNTESIAISSNLSNTHLLGNVLYTDYIHLFQIAGVILLLSMIGAIVLTYRKREGVKTQSYINQISRDKESSIEIVQVSFDKGVKIDD
jgi:NADH-quinone oxidoreductase subunit J